MPAAHLGRRTHSIKHFSVKPFLDGLFQDFGVIPSLQVYNWLLDMVLRQRQPDLDIVELLAEMTVCPACTERADVLQRCLWHCAASNNAECIRLTGAGLPLATGDRCPKRLDDFHVGSEQLCPAPGRLDWKEVSLSSTVRQRHQRLSSFMDTASAEQQSEEAMSTTFFGEGCDTFLHRDS